MLLKILYNVSIIETNTKYLNYDFYHFAVLAPMPKA